MAWPETDVQTYRLTLGEAWVYQSEHPAAGVSGKIGFGWTLDPFFATTPSSDIPVIPHLLHTDVLVAARYGPMVFSTDGSLRAVWEGPVGLSAPRITAGWSTPHWSMVGQWTVPLATLDGLITAPTSAWNVTGSVGTSRARASLGATYRPTLNEYWQPTVYGAVGVGVTRRLNVEARFEGPVVRAEAGINYRIVQKAHTHTLAVGTGLTPTPGSPKLRVTWTSSWHRSPPVAIPPAAVPEMPPVWDPPPLAAEPPPPVPVAPPVVYANPFDAAVGFFSAHPELRFIVETNGTREQAEQIVAEMQLRGILRERVVRIDVVVTEGDIVFDFIIAEKDD